jgi:hypothetical protein
MVKNKHHPTLVSLIFQVLGPCLPLHAPCAVLSVFPRSHRLVAMHNVQRKRNWGGLRHKYAAEERLRANSPRSI